MVVSLENEQGTNPYSPHIVSATRLFIGEVVFDPSVLSAEQLTDAVDDMGFEVQLLDCRGLFEALLLLI